jgi:hypothetical protein
MKNQALKKASNIIDILRVEVKITSNVVRSGKKRKRRINF